MKLALPRASFRRFGLFVGESVAAFIRVWEVENSNEWRWYYTMMQSAQVALTEMLSSTGEIPVAAGTKRNCGESI
jgi:hypothetical protein